MTRIYNNPNLKSIRRKLRNNQTDSERIIWSKLRGKQLDSLKFYRQYSVGKYVLDFYCPKNKLAIEIDGGQHNETNSRKSDTDRTTYLERKGIRVIRFWNNEIVDNLEGVIKKLIEELTES